MPRDITHIILADEAAKVIRRKSISDSSDDFYLINKNISEHQEAFHMGCMAADSFFYTTSPQLSTRLHGGFGEDTRAVVLEMIEQLKEEKNPVKTAEKKAFIYGYLCHMAADLTFHPLIYSISGSQLISNNHSMNEVELSKSCHRYAETWLDLYLMRNKKLSFKKFRPFHKIVANLAMRVRLDDFFTDCFQNALNAKKYTWGDNFDLQAQFHNGMTRQFFVDKVTQNQTIADMARKLNRALDGKLKLYIPGFYDFDKEIPQHLTAGSFIHPVTGKKVQKSLADLERDALDCSVKYVQAADNYIQSGDRESFLKNVLNINLDTGMENSKLSDICSRVTPEVYNEIAKRDNAGFKTKESHSSDEVVLNALKYRGKV